MSNKPKTVEEEIAEVLDGFAEEMLASMRRGKGAKILEFPPKLSEQELIRRQQIIDQSWNLVVERRRELERIAERNLPSRSAGQRQQPLTWWEARDVWDWYRSSY
jgi:hypothetical protein